MSSSSCLTALLPLFGWEFNSLKIALSAAKINIQYVLVNKNSTWENIYATRCLFQVFNGLLGIIFYAGFHLSLCLHSRNLLDPFTNIGKYVLYCIYFFCRKCFRKSLLAPACFLIFIRFQGNVANHHSNYCLSHQRDCQNLPKKRLKAVMNGSFVPYASKAKLQMPISLCLNNIKSGANTQLSFSDV